jgi:chemotaxis protein MotB
MLTLLLTFFIFIIAVSTFKTSEYKRFWKNIEQRGWAVGLGGKYNPTQSYKFALIKDLKLPWLTPEAETMLNQLEGTFTHSDFQGVDVNYDENKISMAVSEQLSFGDTQDRLNEKAKPLLLKLIPVLQSSPFNVAVEGHTDAMTTDKIDNMELSLDRALTVARFLIQNGLDKNKVSVSGCGPYRPVADNRLPEERRRNRRVEINIIINNG